MECGTSQFKVCIKGMVKHEMFGESNCMLFYICNIFYRIMEKCPLIHGCSRHG